MGNYLRLMEFLQAMGGNVNQNTPYNHWIVYIAEWLGASKVIPDFPTFPDFQVNSEGIVSRRLSYTIHRSSWEKFVELEALSKATDSTDTRRFCEAILNQLEKHKPPGMSHEGWVEFVARVAGGVEGDGTRPPWSDPDFDLALKIEIRPKATVTSPRTLSDIAMDDIYAIEDARFLATLTSIERHDANVALAWKVLRGLQIDRYQRVLGDIT